MEILPFEDGFPIGNMFQCHVSFQGCIYLLNKLVWIDTYPMYKAIQIGVVSYNPPFVTGFWAHFVGIVHVDWIYGHL